MNDMIQKKLKGEYWISALKMSHNYYIIKLHRGRNPIKAKSLYEEISLEKALAIAEESFKSLIQEVNL